jgi:hypothetical protein
MSFIVSSMPVALMGVGRQCIYVPSKAHPLRPHHHDAGFAADHGIASIVRLVAAAPRHKDRKLVEWLATLVDVCLEPNAVATPTAAPPLALRQNDLELRAKARMPLGAAARPNAQSDTAHHPIRHFIPLSLCRLPIEAALKCFTPDFPCLGVGLF